MMSFIFSDDVRRNPYPWYAELRRSAPALRDARSGVWMLFGYDDVRRALTDHDAFSSVVSPPTTRPGRWLIFADPPRHTKLRALIMRAFTSRAVAALEPRIRDLARTLLDAASARGSMDLVSEFAAPLPLQVIAGLLGAPTDDWVRFRRWSDGILTLANTVGAGPQATAAAADFFAVHDEMQGYVAALVEERRVSPKDDLLTRLVEAEVDGDHLSPDEILGFFQLLLLAGHETTTNLISNAVLAFSEHPAQLALVRSDPALLPRAIEETLRYRSPVQAAFRVTRRDIDVGGTRIPPGQLVLAMIGSANRDPAVFANPDAFDVLRDPNPHMAFGHGIHFCVGAPLARLEARIALQALLALADLEIDMDEPWQPRATFHVHGPTHLRLRLRMSAV